MKALVQLCEVAYEGPLKRGSDHNDDATTTIHFRRDGTITAFHPRISKLSTRIGNNFFDHLRSDDSKACFRALFEIILKFNYPIYTEVPLMFGGVIGVSEGWFRSVNRDLLVYREFYFDMATLKGDKKVTKSDKEVR